LSRSSLRRLSPTGTGKMTETALGDARTDGFEWPSPPERIPDWAFEEACKWKGLDGLDLLAKAEEACGRSVEIVTLPLPISIWGLHVARGERARIYLNSLLPEIWKRFAVFHEIYHLVHHTRGEDFWSGTATPMTSFEYQADMFAWAAVFDEWTEGGSW